MVLSVTPVVVTGMMVSGGSGSPVTGSRKSSAVRSTSVMEPSSWENLITSACWGVTARMTSCCWPLSVVLPRRAGAGWRRCRCGPAAAGAACPTTCRPWSSTLTLVPLSPGHGDRVVGRVDGHDAGTCRTGEADDHVHVVAGLDERADAGDLVDLDRHARRGRGAVDVVDGRCCCPRRAGDQLAGGHRLAGGLADDQRGVRRRRPRACRRS